MISRIVFLFLVFQSFSLDAQISDTEMEKLKNKWRVELKEAAHELGLESPRKEGMGDFSDSIRRLFLEDTFVVENLYRKQLDKESSTLGINQANLACASEYEKLVEKYYLILLSKLKDDDKPLAVSWQATRKSLMAEERTLIGKLMQEEYSGGGSIQSITYTGRLLTAQKDHVLMLIDFLTHLI